MSGDDELQFISESELAPGHEDAPKLDPASVFRSQKARIAELETALTETLNEYVRLADSGDCGFWNPEEEDHVIAARAALESSKGDER